MLKRLTNRLTSKWRQTYSKTCGYVKSWVAITLVQAVHQCIRVLQITARWIIMQCLQWENGAGLHLYRWKSTKHKICPQQIHWFARKFVIHKATDSRVDSTPFAPLHSQRQWLPLGFTTVVYLTWRLGPIFTGNFFCIFTQVPTFIGYWKDLTDLNQE